VTTVERTVGRAWDLAAQYGMTDRCRNVRASGIGVLDLESDPDATKAVTAECRRAVESDGVDAVILGCAGMARLCAEISTEVGVPVIDGVAAATTFVQSLVTLGLRGRSDGEYAAPPSKSYAGLLGGFAV
jgi:allantoin racemase